MDDADLNSTLQSIDLDDDNRIEVIESGNKVIVKITLLGGKKIVVKNYPNTKEGLKKQEEFLNSHDTLEKLEKYFRRLKNESK